MAFLILLQNLSLGLFVYVRESWMLYGKLISSLSSVHPKLEVDLCEEHLLNHSTVVSSSLIDTCKPLKMLILITVRVFKDSEV